MSCCNKTANAVRNAVMTQQEAIRKAIEAAGSQTKLATLAGCGQQTISDLLNGKRRASASFAIRFEKKTGVSRRILRPDVFGSAA